MCFRLHINGFVGIVLEPVENFGLDKQCVVPVSKEGVESDRPTRTKLYIGFLIWRDQVRTVDATIGR